MKGRRELDSSLNTHNNNNTKEQNERRNNKSGKHRR